MDKIKGFEKNLKIIRKLMGLSAAKLGQQIGVSRQQINNIENGRNRLTTPVYISIRLFIDESANEGSLVKTFLSIFIDKTFLIEDPEKIYKTFKMIMNSVETENEIDIIEFINEKTGLKFESCKYNQNVWRQEIFK